MSRYWSKRFLGLYGTLFLVFVYAPIVMVVVFSFNSNPINMMIWSGFTFDWYWTIFGYPTQLNEQTLYVERDGQKKIVLGKGGATIKQISSEARAELKDILERNVHLFLFIKVRQNWGDDPERYREMGLQFPKD